MITRYTRPSMGRIWEDQNKYQRWLDVELAVTETLAAEGIIPKDAAAEIITKANFSVDRVNQIEAEVKHDVIAFTTSVSEFVGPSSRYFHFGLTSSDVLDTATALQVGEASTIIAAGIDRLLQVLKKRAQEFKTTITVGRTHGIHAEPTTFGLKLALWYDEMVRQRRRFHEAAETMRVGKLSGAVGTFAHLSPAIEEKALGKLGLVPAHVATQVIQRDRHAHYISALAWIGGTLEKIAVEIRHLQRTEVREAEEYFSPGQKGSSAMPHKRNPVLSENLTGLARLVRASVVPALENVALWHERDISHSSVERVMAPDATIALDFALARTIGMMEKLVVYPDRMRKNLDDLGGLVFSQRVLLALTQAGMSREGAYVAVQRNAMAVWREGGSFLQNLQNDPDVTQHLDADALAALFNMAYHTKHVDTVFKRVFGE